MSIELPSMFRLRADKPPPRGRLLPPGDASLSQLALLLALLAVGRSRISGVVESADVLAAAEVVRAFGGEVDRVAPGVFNVQGVGLGGLLEPTGPIQLAGGDGASFAVALAATHPMRVEFVQADSLPGGLAALLARFGARMRVEQARVAITGLPTALPAAFSDLDISEAHRVALMLAALNAPGRSAIPAPSGRLRGAVHVFEAFGAAVRLGAQTGLADVDGLPELRFADVAIPPDPLLSAIAIAAAAVTPGSDLVVADQVIDAGRERFLTSIGAFGATVERGLPRKSPAGAIADVRVRQSGRAALPSTLPDCPEPERIVLQAAAALVAGNTSSDSGLANTILRAAALGEEAALSARITQASGKAEMDHFLAALGIAVFPAAP